MLRGGLSPSVRPLVWGRLQTSLVTRWTEQATSRLNGTRSQMKRPRRGCRPELYRGYCGGRIGRRAHNRVLRGPGIARPIAFGGWWQWRGSAGADRWFRAIAHQSATCEFGGLRRLSSCPYRKMAVDTLHLE